MKINDCIHIINTEAPDFLLGARRVFVCVCVCYDSLFHWDLYFYTLKSHLVLTSWTVLYPPRLK